MKCIVSNVSSKWCTDEIYIKVSEVNKLQYTMMDHETRCMITNPPLADKKYAKIVIPMFKQAQIIIDKIPSILISNGAMIFHPVWKQVYKAKNDYPPQSKHIRHIHLIGDE